MIKIENVSYSVDNYDILSKISLILGERKIGIVGTNGRGEYLCKTS